MNGIFNINKPAGITSFGVIREVKKITGESKIGHLGTLDPLAKGVLPLFLGKATKLIPYVNQGDKSYQVEAHLGIGSTTGDEEGEKTSAPLPDNLSPTQIKQALAGFVGEIEQIPPMYSAIKQEGKRLYELARKGLEVERQPRRIKIYRIENLEIELPKLRFHVHCSKGTYIRVLVEDLGKALGTLAYMSDLTRTSCEGGFLLGNAISLDQMRNLDQPSLLKQKIDPRTILKDWNLFQIPKEQLAPLLNGQRIATPDSAHFLRFDQRQPHCLVQNEQQELISLGHLEFSQDASFFQPDKILA